MRPAKGAPLGGPRAFLGMFIIRMGRMCHQNHMTANKLFTFHWYLKNVSTSQRTENRYCLDGNEWNGGLCNAVNADCPLFFLSNPF